MKQKLLILLCISLLLCSCGCTSTNRNYEKPVTFYYPYSTLSYDSSDSIIGSETRETVHLAEQLQAILEYYLQGPEDSQLQSPFPKNCTIMEISEKDNMLVVMLSPAFGELNGLSLTVACSCLAMTAMEISSCEAVQISAQDTLLNNLPSITLTRSELALTDPIPNWEDK